MKLLCTVVGDSKNQIASRPEHVGLLYTRRYPCLATSLLAMAEHPLLVGPGMQLVGKQDRQVARDSPGSWPSAASGVDQ